MPKHRQLTISYDFVDSPGWQRTLRFLFLLVGFASAYTMGTPSEGVWWFHTAALLVTIVVSSVLVRRYVFGPMDVEPGVVIHFRSLPSDIDEFTVVSHALDPDLKFWLLTVAVQGSSRRWLVWAMQSEIKEPGGGRELRELHSGFSFSLSEDRRFIEALPMNVRGLRVVGE